MLDLVIPILRREGYEVSDTDGDYIFWILFYVLEGNYYGALFRIDDFPKHSTISAWLNRLCLVGLIFRQDTPSQHTIRGHSIRKRRTGYFVNSLDLFLSHTGPLVECYCAWKRGNTLQIITTRKTGKVILQPKSGVIIDPDIISAYERGSGLYFPRQWLRRYQLSPEELQATAAAIGCGEGEIIPKLRQVISGRIYPFGPAFSVLPKVVRGVLHTISGKSLYMLDYTAQEPSILLHQVNATVPDIGFYEYLSRETGLSIAEAKESWNPIAYGRRRHELFIEGKDTARLQRNYDLIFQVLYRAGSVLGNLIERIKEIQAARASGHNDLSCQRTGARMFYQGMNQAIKNYGIPAGSPLFDGWIFEADCDADARRIAAMFVASAEDIIGRPIPVKLSKLQETEKKPQLIAG